MKNWNKSECWALKCDHFRMVWKQLLLCNENRQNLNIDLTDVWQILATFPMNPNNGTQKTFKIQFFMFPQGTCTMPFQRFPQIACKSGCIVALAAIVWLPPTVCFQMSSQIAWLRAYKITLVAWTLLANLCSGYRLFCVSRGSGGFFWTGVLGN